jgi:Holliday junction resolvase RusA-like endonuclease
LLLARGNVIYDTVYPPINFVAPDRVANGLYQIEPVADKLAQGQDITTATKPDGKGSGEMSMSNQGDRDEDFNTRLASYHAWRKAIETECQSLFEEPIDGALEVELWFYLPRPSSVSRDYPTVMPDLDKLVRSVGDGLTQGGAIADDARIVDLHAYKRYSVDGWTGVHIKITQIKD